MKEEIVTLSITKVLSGLGLVMVSMIQPLIAAFVGAFFVTLALESKNRKKALLEKTEYIPVSFMTNVIYIGAGTSLAYFIASTLSGLGIGTSIINPMAGIIGSLSPIILDLFMEGQIKVIVSGLFDKVGNMLGGKK